MAAAFAEGLVVDALLEGLNAVAVQGVAVHDDFQAVMLRWVVAAGEHDAGLGFQHFGGVVEHRGGHQAQVDHVAAGFQQALDQ